MLNADLAQLQLMGVQYSSTGAIGGLGDYQVEIVISRCSADRLF